MTTTEPTTSLDAETPAIDRMLTILATLAVVAGVALRFAPRSGLWLDEALTVNISTLPLSEIPDALRRDGHPPLFYVLLHLWTSVFGSSDGWVRALPALISTATLPVTYLAGRRLAGRAGAEGLGERRTALLALTVMAIMPFGIRYGPEVRMYSLVILLVGIGYLVVDDLLRRGPHEGPAMVLRVSGVALVTTALLWTHYWSMWLLAVVGSGALWAAVRGAATERRRAARALVVGLVAGGVLFLPWVPTLMYQSAHTGTPWGELFGPASVAVITVVDFAGARFGVAQLLSYVLVVLIVLAAVAVLETGRRIVVGRPIAPRVRVELVVFAATLGVGWAASYGSGNTFSSRYSAVVFPFFVLSVAAGLAVLRQPRSTSLVLAAVVVAGVWGGLFTARFERSQTDDIVEAIRDDLAAEPGRTGVVVTCPDQLGVATRRQADRILDQPIEVIPYPGAGDPRFVDWVDYGDRNQASDPAAFVDAVRPRVPDDATVYVVANFTYRTFEGKCERLLDLMRAGRETDMLVERTEQHDEVANLWAIRPPA